MSKNISTKLSLLCATGNAEKFLIGKTAFAKQGIELVQAVYETDEIQGEDAEKIIRDKASKAFGLAGQPLIVTDDSWNIPALNGFPGAYMKSVNHWFKPEDFLALMASKTDHTIYLDQAVAYIDELETVIFQNRIVGSIVDTPRGKTGAPIMKVVTLEGDNGLTIAEIFDQGTAAKRGLSRDVWPEVAEWYKAKVSP